MTGIDEAGPLFDQSGQQVESQYNAESIIVVRQIPDVAAGKCCPRCKASPMRRTQLVWEENTRRARHGTIVLSRLAQRVAPPRYPNLVPRRFAFRRYLALVGTPLTLAALWACCMFPALDISRQQEAGVMPMSAEHVPSAQILSWRSTGWLILTVIGVAVIAWTVIRYQTHRHRVKAALTELEHIRLAYQAERERWRRSWFCSACGAIAVEQDSRHPSDTDTYG
jgi:hypothetical protein